jgi:hypothetical protein
LIFIWRKKISNLDKITPHHIKLGAYRLRC